jgi:hypothetical protein
MSKENNVIKVINPVQRNPVRRNIARCITEQADINMFKICGRGRTSLFKNKYNSYSRYMLFNDLILTTGSLRVCLKKIK